MDYVVLANAAKQAADCFDIPYQIVELNKMYDVMIKSLPKVLVVKETDLRCSL